MYSFETWCRCLNLTLVIFFTTRGQKRSKNKLTETHSKQLNVSLVLFSLELWFGFGEPVPEKNLVGGSKIMNSKRQKIPTELRRWLFVAVLPSKTVGGHSSVRDVLFIKQHQLCVGLPHHFLPSHPFAVLKKPQLTVSLFTVLLFFRELVMVLNPPVINKLQFISKVHYR